MIVIKLTISKVMTGKMEMHKFQPKEEKIEKIEMVEIEENIVITDKTDHTVEINKDKVEERDRIMEIEIAKDTMIKRLIIIAEVTITTK